MALDEWERTKAGWGGFPKRLTQDEEQDGEFEVTTRTDFAKLAWDEWQEAEKKRQGPPRMGEIPAVVWTGWKRQQAIESHN